MTRKDCISFVNHPDAIALISSAGDMTTTPPANTGLSDKFKVTYSLADLFKKSIEREASLFTTFKKDTIGMLGVEAHSPLPEHRT